MREPHGVHRRINSKTMDTMIGEAWVSSNRRRRVSGKGNKGKGKGKGTEGLHGQRQARQRDSKPKCPIVL
jgi:hypothetical protein